MCQTITALSSTECLQFMSVYSTLFSVPSPISLSSFSLFLSPSIYYFILILLYLLLRSFSLHSLDTYDLIKMRLIIVIAAILFYFLSLSYFNQSFESPYFLVTLQLVLAFLAITYEQIL